MNVDVLRDSSRGKLLVGRLNENGFSYSQSYLEKAASRGELGISERLPLRSEPFASSEVAPFFTGLLPEGEVLNNLTRMYQVPRNDYISLIGELGCESIGALTFAAENNLYEFEARYEPLPEQAIKQLCENPVRAATQAASSTRLSLAGAQSKVAWFLPENLEASNARLSDWMIPRETATSNYIVKISQRGEESLAENELACSMIAKSCRIETAPAFLVDGIPGAIAVKRYDRIWVGTEKERQLVRLHQEDFCQALGLMPFYKYQPANIDVDYISLCADLIDDCSENPGADRSELAKRIAFNFAIGNSDAHLKNSSLLYDKNWRTRRLSPIYDITCIPLSGYSTRMPFDIGEHRELEEITAQDILQLALSANVSLDLFDAKVREILAGFEAFGSSETGEISDMAEKILDNAQPRLAMLRDYLGA